MGAMRLVAAIFILTPLVLPACGPQRDVGPVWSEDGSADRIYADRVYGRRGGRTTDGRVLLEAAADRPEFAEAVRIAGAEAATRNGTLAPAELSALQSARRAARMDRQRIEVGRAGRDRVWAERARAQAARELTRAEWLDRRPVGSDPFDLRDIERRREALELSRAAGASRRADRAAAEAHARLGALEREARILDRIDRIDRVQQRQEARERLLATRSDADEEVRRLLPYRRLGESISDFRARIDRARGVAERTGAPIERLLRD